MAIEILVSTPNGAQASYHEIKKFEINYSVDQLPKVQIIVNSWVQEEDSIAGKGCSWVWQLPGQGAESVVFELSDALDAEEALITSVGSPFLGGLILNYGFGPLDYEKKRKLLEFKQEFERKNHAPLVVTNLGTFDADPDSQFKITQTVLLAQTLTGLGEEVSINFTAADNSIVVLDLIKTVQLGLSLAEREQALRARKAELRTKVQEATSVEELQALRWDPTPG